MTWLIIMLLPGAGLLFHTLAGLLFFAPIYGIDSIWIHGWTIEIIPKRKIWGVKSGAQTHGIVKFFTADRVNDEPLRHHENIHIWQEIVFGFIYIATYILAFLVNLGLCSIFDWYKYARGGKKRPLWRRAYLAIPWEIHARHCEKQFRLRIKSATGL